MSAEDEELFGKMIRIENKDIFVDVRKNANGVYLKLSERRGTMRKTVLIPASGIKKLQAVLEEVSETIGGGSSNSNSRPAKSASPKVESGPAEADSNTVYVAGLAWETDEAGLTKHFQTVGPVVKATVLRKPRRGKVVSIGCGIVEFNSIAEANKAIQTLNGTTLDGRTITCREDRKAVGEDGNPKPKNVSPTQIFTSGVPLSCDFDAVREHFASVGFVTRLTKLEGRNKKRGQWVIEYEDPLSVSEAVIRLHNSKIDGHEISVREYVLDD